MPRSTTKQSSSAADQVVMAPVMVAAESVAADGVATASSSDRAALERAAEGLLRELQQSLKEVIARIPGDIDKAVDLQRALKVDAKLAWQIFRFSTAPSVMSAGVLVPRASPMQKFLAAAGRHGVDAAVIKTAVDTFARFERFVSRQVGDRASFQTMVSGGRESESVATAHRKASFRMAAHFLGVQTDVNVITFIITPSRTNEGAIDMAIISYKVGVRRLRPDAKVVLSHFQNTSKLPEDPLQPRFEPLEPEVPEGFVGSLIPQFCSNPSVELVQTHAKGEYVEMELASSSLGAAGATHWAFGLVERNSSVSWGQGQLYAMRTNIAAAVETLVIDVIAPASWSQNISTRVDTFVGFYEGGDADADEVRLTRMPTEEHVRFVGTGLRATRLTQANDYEALMQHAMGRMGVAPEEYAVFRCEVVHPILGTSIRMNFQG